MRFYGLVLAASAAALGACSGGEKSGTTMDSAAMAGTTTASTATTDSSAAAPITGTTHEIKMIGDDKGYRFEPADITIKQGDGLKFVMISGGPHDVAFDPATLPEGAAAQLSANMPQQIAELSGPYLMNPNETYTISFANVPTGSYPYHCTPHLAMGMKGTITVQ